MNRLHLALTGRRGGGAADAQSRAVTHPLCSRAGGKIYAKHMHSISRSATFWGKRAQSNPLSHMIPRTFQSLASEKQKCRRIFHPDFTLRAPKCQDRLAGITLLRLLYHRSSPRCCTHWKLYNIKKTELVFLMSMISSNNSFIQFLWVTYVDFHPFWKVTRRPRTLISNATHDRLRAISNALPREIDLCHERIH